MYPLSAGSGDGNDGRDIPEFMGAELMATGEVQVNKDDDYPQPNEERGRRFYVWGIGYGFKLGFVGYTSFSEPAFYSPFTLYTVLASTRWRFDQSDRGAVMRDTFGATMESHEVLAAAIEGRDGFRLIGNGVPW